MRLPRILSRRTPRRPSSRRLQKDPFLFAPGTSALYSNFGYDLLGVALANASGKPYADLLKERLLDPLGMKDTAFNPPADAKDRLMQGHYFDGSPMPNVPTPVGIECAGGLHTTGADMLRLDQVESRPRPRRGLANCGW